MMQQLNALITSHIDLQLYILIGIAICYILAHQYRAHSVLRFVDVCLNYIPVLTHEFGHILLNKISGGRAKDLVIVVSPTEREQTMQQGYAITSSASRLSQIITTLGGYIMPPLMLYIGVLTIQHNYASLFVGAYILIFIYFLILTSRKVMPLIILIILAGLLYFIFQYHQDLLTSQLISVVIHYILGVLLGEVVQSSWTILRLTFNPRVTEWDGSALRDLTHLPVIGFSALWIVINLYTLYTVWNSLTIT